MQIDQLSRTCSVLTLLCLLAGGGQSIDNTSAEHIQPEQASSAVGFQLRTRCIKDCVTHGTCNEELARCDCPRHRHGPACEHVAKRVSKVCLRFGFPDLHDCTGNQSDLTYRRHHLPTPCLNNCTRQGSCISGWCHCIPGQFGTDCSLSLAPDGSPQLLAAEGYTTRQKRPWVYVYELPPRFTVWHNLRHMDRPLHYLMWQRLLSSGARVADGEQADLFFIPLNLRYPSHGDIFVKALDYVRQTWPWLDQHPGRHFVIHTGDVGRMDISAEARKAGENLTWLTHWGLYEDHDPSGWVASHRLEKDFVIPTFLPAGDAGRSRVFLNSPFHPNFNFSLGPFAPTAIGGRRLAPALKTRPIHLSFAGRICGDRTEPKRNGKWPNCGPRSMGYSQQARQKVHFYYHNRSAYSIRSSDPHYNMHMLQSRFCLAPTGGGFGHRQILVTVAGCLPAVVSDHVLQPLQPSLDWSQFSLEFGITNSSQMHLTIEAVTPEQLVKMQAVLRCVTQHFIYSSIIGAYMGEDGRYDAFESVLEVLRVKALHPTAPQSTYVDIDPDFRRFMRCGAEDDSYGTGAPPVTSAVSPSPPSLCSISALDPDSHSCKQCVMSAQGYVPGGAICCGTGGKLAACPRPWA